MNSRPLVIDVQNLNKFFGHQHAVKDFSLQVAQGEIFCFLGPNGSGKTTSIRMICGLLKIDSGTGLCLGYDITRERAQIKRRTAYMTQRFSYWDDLTIRENLDFVARVYELKNRREAVDKALEELGLQKRANQLAGTLSGGWKQRLALAACVLHGPQLLLLDEPTASVDPTARRHFWEELHRLAARGISVLVSTHYMDEAARCHKLAYLAHGRIRLQGDARDIIQSQNLHTWAIRGHRLSELSERLRAMPGIEQTVVFGSSLHVSGKNLDALKSALESTIKQFARHTNTNTHAEPIETTLEHVFIYLNKNFDPGHGASA